MPINQFMANDASLEQYQFIDGALESLAYDSQVYAMP